MKRKACQMSSSNHIKVGRCMACLFEVTKSCMQKAMRRIRDSRTVSYESRAVLSQRYQRYVLTYCWLNIRLEFLWHLAVRLNNVGHHLYRIQIPETTVFDEHLAVAIILDIDIFPPCALSAL